ncbi:MAG: ADYC domain-containing protein [Caulobacterales bacterium]
MRSASPCPPIASLLICAVASLVIAAGALAAGVSTPTISVDGTRFVVTSPSGDDLSPETLVGAELDSGDGRVVRIDSIEKDSKSIADVWLYRLSARQPTGRWADICTPDREGRSAAIPLPGYFDARAHFVSDPRRFTLACTSGAQGKCVRLGYRPWESDPRGRSVAPTYDACVRMMRADYCGDGRSFTRDGTPVEITDGGRARTAQARARNFEFEAAWGQDGAICVARPRIPAETSLAALATICPRLRGHLGEGRCSRNAPGALLLNSSPLDAGSR